MALATRYKYPQLENDAKQPEARLLTYIVRVESTIVRLWNRNPWLSTNFLCQKVSKQPSHSARNKSSLLVFIYSKVSNAIFTICLCEFDTVYICCLVCFCKSRILWVRGIMAGGNREEQGLGNYGKVHMEEEGNIFYKCKSFFSPPSPSWNIIYFLSVHKKFLSKQTELNKRLIKAAILFPIRSTSMA